MNSKPPYVLAISSFAVHGTASLKTFITFFGEKILPVPSLVLNGLTNMALVKKVELPFAELLRSVFDLAANRELELILYIGYLGNGEQAAIISDMIGNYRNLIKTIITDPVCGDHGRVYVPQDVIDQWPELIRQSDFVFPNVTELKVLTGHQPDDDQAPELYIQEFKERFPKPQLVVTSVKSAIGIGLESFGDEPFSYHHPALSRNYGGSGDAFLSLFILHHFYGNLSINHALKKAAEQTYHILKNSIEKGSDDIILEIPNNQSSKYE
jgi:pyridoxal/pyridoxine/pyridoxamine kinase